MKHGEERDGRGDLQLAREKLEGRERWSWARSGRDPTVVRLLAEMGLRAKGEPRSLKDMNFSEYDLVVAVCDEMCITLENVETWSIERIPPGRTRTRIGGSKRG